MARATHSERVCGLVKLRSRTVWCSIGHAHRCERSKLMSVVGTGRTRGWLCIIDTAAAASFLTRGRPARCRRRVTIHTRKGGVPAGRRASCRRSQGASVLPRCLDTRDHRGISDRMGCSSVNAACALEWRAELARCRIQTCCLRPCGTALRRARRNT